MKSLAKLLEITAKILRLDSITPSQIATLLAQFITGLAAFITACVNGGPNAALLATAVFALTVTLTFDKINKYRFENETTSKLDRMYMQKSDLEYIGDITHGVTEAVSKCKRAIYIKNTLFDRTNPNNQAALDEFQDIAKNKFLSSIVNGCNWTDIYKKSQEEVADDMINSLNKLGENTNIKGTYTAIPIADSSPFLQVMLIKISEAERIVLFGWTLAEAEQARVYKSTDIGTFMYFERYFDEIKNVCKVDDVVKMRRPTKKGSPAPNHKPDLT